MAWTLPSSYKRLSDVPGTREFNIKHSEIPGRGGGFIHVPGQVGTYSEWMQPGAQEVHARNVGQMQAAKEQWRALSMPGMYADEKAYQAGLTEGAFLAPGTGRASYGTAIRVGGPIPGIPALTTQSIASRVTAHEARNEARVVGTTASRSAGTGVAGGGTALARGGPAIGVAPGGGLDLSGITGGIGSSITSAGTGVMSMVTQYLPLAVKIGAALIGIKMLLWLVRKK